MRKDDILLNKVIEEAGLLSRAAARTKAVGGAVKQGIGDVATAISGKKPAPDAGWRGKYRINKQDQILKTLSNDILNDLTKLGLLPKGSPLNPKELQNVLSQYVGKYTGVNRQASNQPTSTGTSQLPANLQDFRVGQPLPSTQQQAVEPEPTQTQSTAPAWRDVFKPSDSAPQTPAATSASTVPSGATETAPSAPQAPATKPSASKTKPAAIKNSSSQDEIPNESTISDRKGVEYEYYSEDKTWYIRSKAGGSLKEIPNSTPEIQNSITKAWTEKSKKQKAEKEKEAETFASSAFADPEEQIPNESTITDKKGNIYQYNQQDDKWSILSKAGRSTSQIPNDRPEVQNSISTAWRNKKKKGSTPEVPAFEESFKNYFWTN
jgi:hypothetical protein